MEELIIENGNVYLKEYTITKKLSMNDLAKQLVSVEQSISTPQLPLNTIKYKTEGVNHYYYILIPEDNYNLQYGTTSIKSYLVRLPNIIIRFKFKKDLSRVGRIETKMYWTMDKEVDLQTSKFYIPPISNVHQSCNICTGTVKIGLTQHENVINYINMFFSNTFNNDISSGKKSIAKVASEQKKLFPNILDEHDLIKLWWYQLNLESNTLSNNKEISGTYFEVKNI